MLELAVCKIKHEFKCRKAHNLLFRLEIAMMGDNFGRGQLLSMENAFQSCVLITYFHGKQVFCAI